MLLEVLSTCKAFASAPDAVGMRTEEWSTSWSDALLVDFAHMSQKTTAICETWILLACRLVTFVWSFVLVHVFVPFARSPKHLGLADTSFMLADDLTFLIPRRLSFRTSTICLYGIPWCWDVSVRQNVVEGFRHSADLQERVQKLVLSYVFRFSTFISQCFTSCLSP